MLEKRCRPCNLEEIRHVPCARILETFSAENFPNVILSGAEGAGKRTLLNGFIKHIFKREVHYMSYSIEVAVSPSKKVEVDLLEYEDAIEVRATVHDSYDKKILQKIAKDLSETQSIKNALLSSGKRAKMLIIPDGEDLSQGAQMALRRIMEQGANNFRIAILTTSTNSYIEAFKSRFLICRVPGIDALEIEKIIEKAAQREGVFIENKTVQRIAKESEGNARKAFALAEIAVYAEKEVFSTKWENDIEELARKIMLAPTIKTVIEAREKIYSILDKNIPGHIIMALLVKSILKKEKSVGLAGKVLEYAGAFDARLHMGKRDLFHIEAFIARTASIYSTLCSNNK